MIKLVTYQSKEALEFLEKKGYLETDPTRINKEKYGYAYSWIIENMNKKIDNPHNVEYPLWCWVKCYDQVEPEKREGIPVKGFDVEITFHEDEKNVFITDFRRYSFILNNRYVPSSLEDKNMFDKKLEKYNITSEDLKAFVRKDKYPTSRTDKEFIEICDEIRKSFDRIITTDSDVLQGCVWRINKKNIDEIKLLSDDGYCYGTLNYRDNNGNTKNWIDEYHKMLK